MKPPMGEAQPLYIPPSLGCRVSYKNVRGVGALEPRGLLEVYAYVGNTSKCVLFNLCVNGTSIFGIFSCRKSHDKLGQVMKKNIFAIHCTRSSSVLENIFCARVAQVTWL